MLVRIALVCIALSSASPCFAYIVDGSRVHQPRLLSYVKERLPNQGTLQQTEQGFAYLKVSDHYITDLLSQLSVPGFQTPKYNRSGAINGAHISVMYEREAKNLKIQELGQTIKFHPLGFYTVVVDDHEYFMLAVDAPELCELRQKYGLPDKIENHAFHITIAVRKIKVADELASAEEYHASNSKK